MKSIKNYLGKLRSRGPVTLALAVIVSVFFVTGLVSAATTISTSIQTDGTLSVTGLSTLLGGATTTSVTLLNGETISNDTDGTITFGASNTVLAGTASSSAIRVGTFSDSTVSGIIFGTCNLTTITVVASTTNYTTCNSAVGVTSAYKVFVQATSSLPAGLLIDSASSSAASVNTISLRLVNIGWNGASIASGAISINFWAIR